MKGRSANEKVFVFRQFFKVVDKELAPDMLGKQMVLAHMNEQARNRSGHAANKDRKNLVAAWNWGHAYLPGWPRDNPFQEVPRQREVESPRYVPPVEDFWKIYDSLAMGQDKVMLFMFLHTAARRSELFKLLWSDVDFERRKVRLWTQKRRGGLEQDWIPMTGELFDMLSWWHEHRTFPEKENVFICEDMNNFCKELYGSPFKHRRHWMSRLCERVGVEPFGFHAIRRLSASILDDVGYPITVIQGGLRRRSANTTAKHLHKLRGLKVALDDAFRRSSAPAPAEKEKVEEGRAERLVFHIIPGGLNGY